MRILNTAVILIALLMTGCATMESPNTQSGKPEVTVQGAVADQFLNAAANRAVNRGWTVQVLSSNMLTIAKHDIAMGGQVSWTFTALELNNSTRIVATFYYPRSSYGIGINRKIYTHAMNNMREIAESIGVQQIASTGAVTFQ